MPTSQPIILCVDDDADDLFFITSIIHKEHPTFHTAVATNGEEALQYLAKQKELKDLPALILLDINMPMLNGKEVLSRIKEDPLLRAIPIAVFSTSNLPSDRLFCAHFGIDMVTKPNSIPELERMLQKLLNHVFHY